MRFQPEYIRDRVINIVIMNESAPMWILTYSDVCYNHSGRMWYGTRSYTTFIFVLVVISFPSSVITTQFYKENIVQFFSIPYTCQYLTVYLKCLLIYWIIPAIVLIQSLYFKKVYHVILLDNKTLCLYNTLWRNIFDSNSKEFEVIPSEISLMFGNTIARQFYINL